MTFRTAVLASRPALFWLPGDRAGTTTADLSGNGRTGTYTGTLTRGTAPPFAGMENGATLDGSTGYLERAYDAALDIGTGEFAALVIANVAGSATAVHPLLHRDTGSTGNGIIMNLQDSGTAWNFYCAGVHAFGSTPSLVGAPHVFVSTRRAGVLYAHADGALLGQTNSTGTAQSGGRIQAGHDDNPDFAKGSIFAVAFWTRGLHPVEIQTLWQAARGLPAFTRRRR